MAADPRGRFVRGQVSDIHKIGGSLIHIAMKIPDVVLQEASETMEMLEGTLVYLGKIGDGRSSDVTFLPNNLHLSEIIRKFATEMMA